MEQVLLLSFYKLHLQYCGTNYLGFQIQPEGKTIQGELNNAIKLIAKSDEIKTIGSGRTDSGVHAFGQIVRIEMPLEIEGRNLVRALNTKLPNDIRVIHAETCSENFHPIFSAKSKEYNYVFSTKEIPSPFVHDLVTFHTFELDMDKVQAACKEFIGEYDFVNFQAKGTEVESTVRRILECECIHFEVGGPFGNILSDYYVVRVVGNGFLKQMVRLMMGAIFNAGRGKITNQDIKSALLGAKVERLGATAPPNGLYLKEVHY